MENYSESESEGSETSRMDVAPRIVETAKVRAQQAGTFSKGVLVRAASKGHKALSGIADTAKPVWRPEDAARVLAQSPAFGPFPSVASGSLPLLLNTSWRSDALLGLSALGVTAWEHEITQTTRALFHDGLSHQNLSFRMFGQNFDAIHRWIDTVPGSGVRGGGIVHRLQHGHDASAALQLYEAHGLPGALVWLQHIAQDFTTPTGVPVPVGGQRLANWLVEEGYTTSGKAALLLSLNVAELAASVLAGAFALRLANLIVEIQNRRAVRSRCKDAEKARQQGDLDAVIHHYSQARSLSDNDPSIVLALGWAYAEIGRPTAESFLTFRSAAESFAVRDRLIEQNGLALSLRGVSYLLALSQAMQVLQESNLRDAWRSELDRMLRGLVASFEKVALQHVDPVAQVLGHELTWRPRPLSAAMNYYLAARAVQGAPFLPSASEAERLSQSAANSLDRAAAMYPESEAEIRRAQERWVLECAPTMLLAR